jgi:hypothetical protein
MDTPVVALDYSRRKPRARAALVARLSPPVPAENRRELLPAGLALVETLHAKVLKCF